METLFTLQLLADTGLLVLIWLVQLIMYPSFQYTEAEHFIRWHQRYAGRISLFVIPLMLLQVGVELLLILHFDGGWLRLSLIMAVWSSTFLLSVPYHRLLHDIGKDMQVIRRLIWTNWIRTALWSILFLDSVWHFFNRV